tara:strand:- start:805 stop:1311 length:507 start_codon:yes stop_codon:yes gene_type:complete
MSDNNFESRLLYTQASYVDEEIRVKSSVYAIVYNLKSGIAPITARCRVTIVYTHSETNGLFEAKGGTVEKWSDKGWQIVDEYFDVYNAFDDADSALSYLLQMFKSFLLGTPIGVEPDTKPAPDIPPTNPDKVPKIRVLSFAKEKAKSEKIDNKKSDKPSTDDPDFDWI